MQKRSEQERVNFMLELLKQEVAVEHTVADVMKWDFSLLSKYMLDNNVYESQEVIDAMLVEYARYIALSVHYPNQGLMIADVIDDFWHTHVLFTEDYHAFGNYLGAGYIHHRPFVADQNPIGTRETAFAKLKSLYIAHFGSIDEQIWQIEACGKCTCTCGGP